MSQGQNRDDDDDGDDDIGVSGRAVVTLLQLRTKQPTIT
jgi:hypothetical protein